MSVTRTPAKHFAPLAIGAPEPYRALPVRLERMIHFIPPHNDKIRAKLKDTIKQVDVVLGNLEDAIAVGEKEQARQGFVSMAQEFDFGSTGLWTRINCLNSPWMLDDVTEIVKHAGNKVDVIMLPKVEGPWDLWHYTVGKMVDACLAYGLKPFYGPFGDFADSAACEAQFRNAFIQGCLGAWSLHPSQIEIAKRVFSPDVKEVLFAKRILDAMPDGTGAVMIDGKMQDDATWKQAKVIVDLAKIVASKDAERASAYGL